MLFKFTTQKPPVKEIWNKVNNLSISSSIGRYTDIKLKFILFCTLQLIDFKKAKFICNSFLNNPSNLSILNTILHMHYIDFDRLKEPIQGFPSFISEDLYIPYYMLMQFQRGKNDELWYKLFDRKKEDISDDEYNYLFINADFKNTSITKYKLWKYGNTILADKYNNIFKIDNTLSPTYITNKKDILIKLTEYMNEYLTNANNNPIYNYDKYIYIPEFRLNINDTNIE